MSIQKAPKTHAPCKVQADSSLLSQGQQLTNCLNPVKDKGRKPAKPNKAKQTPSSSATPANNSAEHRCGPSASGDQDSPLVACKYMQKALPGQPSKDQWDWWCKRLNCSSVKKTWGGGPINVKYTSDISFPWPLWRRGYAQRPEEQSVTVNLAGEKWSWPEISLGTWGMQDTRGPNNSPNFKCW